jgi:hypothetical protein
MVCLHGLVSPCDSVWVQIRGSPVGPVFDVDKLEWLNGHYILDTPSEPLDHLLVEVKNFHQKKPYDPYRMRGADLDALQRYADMVGGALMIAIYWTRWNIWTLTDSSRMAQSNTLSSHHCR